MFCALGGVQLVAIGIIGEYLGRMFDETKGRPLYLINAYNPSAMQIAPRVKSAGEVMETEQQNGLPVKS